MPRYENVPNIYVFLASPDDLPLERQATQEIVDELNGSVCREIGLNVILLKWEDISPGANRPQERINRDVDDCDLFVGLLWRRWGTPTGGYSSGFHEEFNRALKRSNATGSPEIWLCFKDVDPGQLSDPGRQLQQVLAFREER